MKQDTICALATPPGGAIAIIRVSGPDAIAVTEKIFSKSLEKADGYTLHFGQVTDADGMELDEVLVSLFRAPHSYTGEDSIEISCHGSAYIVQRLLESLIKNGARQAEPGEYTMRAFMNGKLDLSQAEAVADLISSSTQATHQMAMNQLRGQFSKELAELRGQLLQLTSLLELELDFNDQDVEFANREQLTSLMEKVEKHISGLADSFQTGNAIKNGIPVAIIGAPNVGKSTLLNALVGEERAIVSNIQGTTRDTVEETLVIGGMLFRFIDTAGMRQTEDKIENLGIERSLQAAQKAAVIIHLQDATHPINTLSQLADTTDKTILQVYNKVDLVPSLAVDKNSIRISAKNGTIEVLKQALVSYAEEQYNMQNAVTISSTRHYEALVRAQNAIQRVKEGLKIQISGEFMSMDLQDCLAALGEITGQISSQEVLNNIFSKFCIGK